MHMLRSLIIIGLALFALANLAVALFVAPVLTVPVSLGLASVLMVLFIVTTPSLRFKPVMRRDSIQQHLRLFRLLWERGSPGDGKGYSNKLAIGLRPRLFEREREYGKAFLFTILGLRIHYSRSYGGIFG